MRLCGVIVSRVSGYRSRGDMRNGNISMPPRNFGAGNSPSANLYVHERAASEDDKCAPLPMRRQRYILVGITGARGDLRGKFMSHEMQFYIDGVSVDPMVANAFDVIDPSNEDAFAQISRLKS
jgi:hypothetical protein